MVEIYITSFAFLCLTLILVSLRIVFRSKWDHLIGDRGSSIFWSVYAFLAMLAIFLWHGVYMQNARIIYFKFHDQLAEEKMVSFVGSLSCNLDFNLGLVTGLPSGLFTAVLFYIFGNSGVKRKGLVHAITKRWLTVANISKDFHPSYYGVTVLFLFLGTFMLTFEIVAWLVDLHLTLSGAEFVWALTFSGILGISAFLQISYSMDTDYRFGSRSDELKLLELKSKNLTEILHLVTYGSLIGFLSFFAAFYYNWAVTVEPIITSTSEYGVIGLSVVLLYFLIIAGMSFGIIYPVLHHSRMIEERLKYILQKKSE